MNTSFNEFQELLENLKIPAVFEKLDKFSTLTTVHITILNRLRMEFIMGLQGIAYFDFHERMRIFIKMILENQTITPSQIDQIGKYTYNILRVSLETHLENTPKIITEIILVEHNEQKKEELRKLLDKWYHYENIYQTTPNAKFMVIKALKMQIKNELLTFLKPKL